MKEKGEVEDEESGETEGEVKRETGGGGGWMTEVPDLF